MRSFDVTVAAEPHFLRVTTVGKYSFSELLPFLALVKDEAAKAEKANVLIDSRSLEGSMTEAERFLGGQKIAELFGARVKVAVLMPESQITHLGELAASNRGGRFRATSDEDDALDWLLS